MELIKKGNNKFYIGEDMMLPLAEITFVLSDDRIIIEHTYVSETLKGQGIGQQLVKKAAEFAREENKKIIPKCSYAKKVMTQNEEYNDVLVNE